MKFSLLSILILTGLHLMSCSDKGALNFSEGNSQFIEENDNNIDLSGDIVSFADIKTQVLDSKCISCHNTDRAAGGVNLETYSSLFEENEDGEKIVTTGSPEHSRLYVSVAEGSMPKGRNAQKLSSDEIALIEKFINDGAKETSEFSFATLEASYENLDKFILQQSCVGCHSTERSAGGVDLTSYQALFKTNEDGEAVVTATRPDLSRLYLSVDDGSMPKGRNATKLSDDKIAFIKRFIEEGARNSSPSTAPINNDESEDEDEDEDSVIILANTKANFENIYTYIIKDKCLSCHKTGRARGEVNLDNYDSMFEYTEYFSPLTVAGKPEESAFYTSIVDGSMPRGRNASKLSNEEIAFVQRWIKEGALKQ